MAPINCHNTNFIFITSNFSWTNKENIIFIFFLQFLSPSAIWRVHSSASPLGGLKDNAERLRRRGAVSPLSSGARAITAIKASQKAEISPIPFVLIKNGRSRCAYCDIKSHSAEIIVAINKLHAERARAHVIGERREWRRVLIQWRFCCWCGTY